MVPKKTKTNVPEQQSEILTLSRISAALSGLWDLDAILGVGLDSALEFMNGTVGEILLIDENNQSLSRRVYRGLSQEFVNGQQTNLGEGVTGSVVQSGKAILVEDVSVDPRVQNREIILAEGLKSFI